MCRQRLKKACGSTEQSIYRKQINLQVVYGSGKFGTLWPRTILTLLSLILDQSIWGLTLLVSSSVKNVLSIRTLHYSIESSLGNCTSIYPSSLTTTYFQWFAARPHLFDALVRTQYLTNFQFILHVLPRYKIP